MSEVKKKKNKRVEEVVGKTKLVNKAHKHSKETGKWVKKVDLENAYDVLVYAIKEMLREGKGVRFNGIGMLYVKEVRGLIGRNPVTGEKMNLAPSKRFHFKASRIGKDYMKMTDEEEKEYRINMIKESIDDESEISEVSCVIDLVE